ncbi:ABC transporter ATP-binding protein [Thermofilum pendens]|uniref:ABC transporter related n=1 Tax=Thermofilum pendens (strain DSM 2475 / Hrk 5) TaxID=368408 RepID=A1S0J5_THEPD|nr:ABC transporter ATP-binding protein [Thermofilum pendens]ABL78975.1 ABC transporter related [Thermofilum pendens Hrk 5]
MVGVLRLVDVYSGYGKMEVLHGVSFELGKGEIAAVLGPNGAGKTTMLNTIFGLATLHRGEVSFNGVKLNGRKPSEIVKLGVSYAPQLDNVFPNLTVEENLVVGAFIRGKDPGIRSDIEDILDLFPEIKRRRNQKAKTLSGGERQMLAVARALMTRPSVLLLDEPTSGLSPKAGATLMNKIKEIQQTRGVAILLVEQNVARALEIADRAAVLVGGKIVREGSADEFKSIPIERLFFGK